MTEFTPPEDLIEQIKYGDEPAKASARKQIIDWFTRADMKSGDVVWVPDPSTGDLIRHTMD